MMTVTPRMARDSRVVTPTPFPDASETSVITHPAPPTYQGLPVAPWQGSLLQAQQKHGKGGVVGTNGKAAIAFRFDDWQSAIAPIRRVGQSFTWTQHSAQTWKLENYPYAVTKIFHQRLAQTGSGVTTATTNAMLYAQAASIAACTVGGKWRYESGGLYIAAMDRLPATWEDEGGANLFKLTGLTYSDILYMSLGTNDLTSSRKTSKAAVTANNQWFYDTATGTLYYYKDGGTTVATINSAYYLFAGINPNTHNYWVDSANIVGLMNDRGFPFSLVTIGDGPAAQNFANNWDASADAPTTWWDNDGVPASDAEIMARRCSWRYWIDCGAEAWCHSKDHRDPFSDLAGYNGSEAERRANLIEWISTAKTSLETNASKTVGANTEAPGIKVQGFAKPGTTQLSDYTPYGPDGLNTSIPGYLGEAGRLIMDTYPQSEAYAGYGPLLNTGSGFHGRNQTTASDTSTLATVIANVDLAISNGGAMEFMCHAGNLIGVTGYDFDGTADDTDHLTLAEFVTLLDYVQAKRTQGLIEVLAPSSLPYFDPTSSNRVSLLPKVNGLSCGDWNAYAAIADVTAVWGTGPEAATLEATGGPDGGKYVSFPAAETELFLLTLRTLQSRNIDGMTFCLKAWVRSNHATDAARPYIIIKDAAEGGAGWGNGDRININTIDFGRFVGAAPIGKWTQIYFTFTIPAGCNAIELQLGHANEAIGIDYGRIDIEIV